MKTELVTNCDQLEKLKYSTPAIAPEAGRPYPTLRKRGGEAEPDSGAETGFNRKLTQVSGRRSSINFSQTPITPLCALDPPHAIRQCIAREVGPQNEW